MKIAIDISPVIYGTGVSTYTKNLVSNLLAIDKMNEYILFGGSLRRKAELSEFTSNLVGNFREKLYALPPTLLDLLWNRLHVIGVETFLGEIDIYHSSDWTQPPTRAFKVTTVHDLSPLRYPKLTDPKIISVTKARLKWIIKEIDRVIVPSRATEDDLVLMKIKRKKIRVIAEAADTFYKPVDNIEVERFMKKYNLRKNFLISVGVNERKNSDRIIKAYRQLKDKNITLVFIGEDQLGLKDVGGVRILGHVNRQDLRALYTGASALVYPSLYEGFGLPILEAFACNCPVITSNTSSLPEVAGDAAILVDPYNIESITNGIIEAMKIRKNLVKRGKERLKKYSWEKTAKETLSVYNEGSDYLKK